MTGKNIGPILAGILTGAMVFNAQAQLYKWVDDEGNVHYSDQQPADDTEASVVADPQPQSNSSSTATSVQPLMRPYDRKARKLHLSDVRYRWKAESHSGITSKVGVYHTGRACTTRGAIMAPDVFIHHGSLLPSETKLAYRVGNVLEGLDYESEHNDRYRLPGRMQKTGGLSLHAEIIDLDLQTCAPGTRKSERLTPMESIGVHRFSKNRVHLMVRWRLKDNRDQDLVYEATIPGSFNGWNQKINTGKAMENALESSVLALFSDRDFVAGLLLDKGESVVSAESPVTESTPASTSTVSDRYILQAHLAQAFSEINAIKIGSIQYYATEGDWPRNLSQLGYSDSLFRQSDSIDHVDLQADGSIVVELKGMFGRNKHIRLRPETEDGGIAMNRWHCSSNLNSNILPWSCEGI